MPIQIDKGIPLVPKQKGKSKKCRFTKEELAQMQPGDRFFLKGLTNGGAIGGSLRYIEQKLQFEFATRSVKGGVRVWRVK